jgi:hypothetical protein
MPFEKLTMLVEQATITTKAVEPTLVRMLLVLLLLLLKKRDERRIQSQEEGG